MLNIDDVWSKLKPRILGLMGVPTAYTPVWTAATANPAIGNGMITGRYILKPGKQCRLQIKINMGSTTTYGTGVWSFSLPFSASAAGLEALGVARVYDSSANTHYLRQAQISIGASSLTYIIKDLDTNATIQLSSTNPITWASADALIIDIEYEVE